MLNKLFKNFALFRFVVFAFSIATLSIFVSNSSFSQDYGPGQGNGEDSCKANSDEVLFVMDVSGSMKGAKFVQAKHSLITHVKTLGKNTSSGLIKFSGCGPHKIQKVVPMAKNNASHIERATGVLPPPSGATELARAIDAAGRIFKSKGKCGHIVMFSDGVDTCGGMAFGAAKNLGCSCLHIIGIQMQNFSDRWILKETARLGKGLYCNAITLGGIERCLKEIASERAKSSQGSKEKKSSKKDDGKGPKIVPLFKLK
jgi:Ca-activated chloride channel family protein